MALEGALFAENPEPRCPCVLLLDTSTSMSGTPMSELNRGLAAFKDELAADALASKRIELAIVTFGPVRTALDFASVEDATIPTLAATGDTPMGRAILEAIDLVETRKLAYKRNGVDYYRPWIFLITDGGPTDAWRTAAEKVRDGEHAKKFQFFAVGVKGANFDILRSISVREPIELDGLRFRDLFSWLSSSLASISHSGTGDSIVPENPLGPSGWGVVGGSN